MCRKKLIIIAGAYGTVIAARYSEAESKLHPLRRIGGTAIQNGSRRRHRPPITLLGTSIGIGGIGGAGTRLGANPLHRMLCASRRAPGCAESLPQHEVILNGI
jgi:hypothetical protein